MKIFTHRKGWIRIGDTVVKFERKGNRPPRLVIHTPPGVDIEDVPNCELHHEAPISVVDKYLSKMKKRGLNAPSGMTPAQPGVDHDTQT